MSSDQNPGAGAAGPIPITVAHGDGIGPEIMDATLRILDAAGAPLRYDVIEIGQKLYEQGHTSGIAPEAWDTIRRNRVFLKAPITTPLGGGYKSLNVTIRKSLGLFANVRPSKSYTPYVASPHPGMNMVIIRENEEDLYAGIEHQQTQRGHAGPEADHPTGLRAHRALRLRVRPRLRPPEGHLHDEGQHHEAHGRALPPGLRGGRAGVPGHRERAPDHRHRRRARWPRSRRCSTWS
jgi:hypothetical protein